MGCCQSTTAEHDDARPADRPRLPVVAVRSHSPSSNDSRRISTDVSAPRLTGTDRPNKPIRQPSPIRTSPTHVSHLTPPWTRSQLVNERAAFFDTRVSGRPEVWNALRLVCELLQKGDIEQAQGILDAADLSCPFGRVAVCRGRDRSRGGVYDVFGELYELPAWVVTDPADIIEGQEKPEDATEDFSDDDKQSEQDRRREEKGKGRATDLGEIMQLRARISDHSTDVTVSVGKKEKVAAIVRKIQDQIGAKRLRLVYLGHVLNEGKTLEAQGYRPGDLVNAYVFEASEEWLRKRTV